MSLKISIDDVVIFDNSAIENSDFDRVQVATQILHWATGFFNTHPEVTKIEVERV